MSKNNKAEEITMANPKGKTVDELKEVIQNLQVQLNQEQTLLVKDQSTVRNRQAKVLKMQGALEVMLQLIPKEEVEKIIAQEAKEAQQENNSDS